MMTDKELGIAGHTLGINVYHAKRSKLKRDKKLPKEFYRNFFCGGEGHHDYPTLVSLEQKGYMERGESFDKQTVFWVTDAGKDAFKVAFIETLTTQPDAE